MTMGSASVPNYVVLKSPSGTLLHNVLNEILNGFAVHNFESTIGLPRSEVEELFRHLNQLSNEVPVQLTRTEAWAAHNALREALRELGIEEFQTRTGFDFAESERVLRRLGRLLHEAQ